MVDGGFFQSSRPYGLQRRASLRSLLVEITSTDRVEARHVRDLQRFLPDFPGAVPLCLSRDPLRRRVGGMLAVPWQEGLAELGL